MEIQYEACRTRASRVTPPPQPPSARKESLAFAGDGRLAAASPPLHVIKQRLDRWASSPVRTHLHSRPAALLFHLALASPQCRPATHATTSRPAADFNLFCLPSPPSLSFPLPPALIDWRRLDSCSPRPSRKCREMYRRKQIRRWP